MKKTLIFLLLVLSTMLVALNNDNYIPNDGIITLNERTPGEMEVTVRTTTHNGAYAPRHCFALWITNDSDTFVKTLERKALSYMQHLVKFNQMTGGNSVGAVTGASLNYHTTHNLTWDGNDYNGNEVPDGTYRIYIEFTESNSLFGNVPDGPWTMLEFEKGTESYEINSDIDTYFHDLSVDYTALLPVTMMNFAAQAENDLVRVAWQAVESNLAGYNIYRSLTDNMNDAVAITSNLIPAQNMDVPANYTFEDNNVEADNTYYYWLEAMANDASSYFFGPVSVLYSPVSNDENVNTVSLAEVNNYPNPFNPETTISFNQEVAGRVVVKVYNTKGQLIETIADRNFPQGKSSVVFKADGMASGVYYYSVESGSNLIWNSMVLVK